MAIKPKKDNGWSVPCESRLQPPYLNLSLLPKEKKQRVWKQIQAQHPAIAALLRSTNFKEFKLEIESRFGPVEIGVDLKEIGGSRYGVGK